MLNSSPSTIRFMNFMGSPSVGNKPFQVYPDILIFENEMAL